MCEMSDYQFFNNARSFEFFLPVVSGVVGKAELDFQAYVKLRPNKLSCLAE